MPNIRLVCASFHKIVLLCGDSLCSILYGTWNTYFTTIICFSFLQTLAIVIVPTFTNVYHLPDTKYAGETPENFDIPVLILCLLLITGLVSPLGCV